MRIFSWLAPLMLCAPEGEGGAGGNTNPPPKPDDKDKSDGRTERAVHDDVARLTADVTRLKVHTGLDQVLEDDAPAAEGEGEAAGGVDDILAEGLVLGDDDDEEDAPAQAKKSKAA